MGSMYGKYVWEVCMGSNMGRSMWSSMYVDEPGTMYKMFVHYGRRLEVGSCRIEGVG